MFPISILDTRSRDKRRVKELERWWKQRDRGCFNLKVDVLVGLSTPAAGNAGGFRPSDDFRSRTRCFERRFIACTGNPRKNAKRVVNNRVRDALDADAMIEHLLHALPHFSHANETCSFFPR